MKHLRTTAIAAILALPSFAAAQETISLTVASSHPTTIPWVAMIQTHFMAETDRILAEEGNYEISWDEAFGGTLYRANATLTSVEEGITDIGWVFSYLEGAKMPLSQVTAYTPFATSNVPVQLSVMRELFNENEAFRNEWEQYNIVMLGMTASDSYDLYTKTPVASLADLEGMRISAPGVLGTWLRGTGASAVDGALTTFYTDIQTGVSDGVLSLALGALPTRIYEVAPYVTRVQMGTVFSGGVAINRDRWESLPEEVQQAMLEAGAYYSEAHAQDMMDRPEVAMEQIATLGADQSTPVTIVEMDPAERQAWVDALPNLAGEWAAENDGRGLPAAD
ncbi:C4-dicarboxylate TRAP transporter substrate-binding protein, partial [Yoonia sp.]|uniref:C4-dicarboxylate TRAP transporter substrate-binding protein n=1 Tax=Yoonia sp. TaxID=2212373 RepID=UPI00391B1362